MKHKYIGEFRILIILFFILINIVHFSLRDKIYPISALYYAFPPLIIVLLSIVLSIFYFLNKKIFYSLILYSFFFLAYWFNTSYVFHQPIKSTLDKIEHILFWNVAKKEHISIDTIVEMAKKYKIGIIALVEARFISNEELSDLKYQLPNYSFKKLRGEMFLGVRGKIDSIFYHYKVDRYKFNHVELTIDQEKKSLIIIDVASWPLINRKPILETILKYAEDRNISFLLGDYNTPYESDSFNSYKINYYSFHPVSEGFTATWPYGIPLLELDHIWVKKYIKPLQLKKLYYKASDHALLIGEYKQQSN